MPNEKGTLFTVRVIWAALMLGQVIFLIIALIVVTGAPPALAGDPETYWILFGVCAATAAGSVPAGFIFRRIQYRRRREDATVNPAAYFTGNIVFWSCCEGPALFGIVIFMISGVAWPILAIPALMLALQAITVPTGQPMRDPLPRAMIHE